jgi:hypothetical protein
MSKKRRPRPAAAAAAPAAAPPPAAAPATSAWDRYWFGPPPEARTFLLLRGFLLLLGFDCASFMVAQTFPYGLNGINVAHFAWLDAVQPLPTAAAVAAVLLVCGVLSLLIAFTGGTRWLRAALCALFTYAWACSLLDTFQHHVLFSFALFAFVFFPRPGFAMFCTSMGIVYVFAAVQKLEKHGVAFRLLASDRPPFSSLAAFATEHGVAPSTFWSAATIAVILAELAIAAGYLLAPSGRTPRRLGVLLAATAIGLHTTVEILGLRIGWFSYYMMLAAAVVFLPASWLEAALRPVAWLRRQLRARPGPRGWAAVLLAAGAAALGALAIAALDLPGAAAAAWIVAGATLAGAVAAKLRGHGRAAVSYAALTALACVLIGLATAASSTRYDYYRKLGALLQRIGQPEAARAAKDKAKLYAD